MRDFTNQLLCEDESIDGDKLLTAVGSDVYMERTSNTYPTISYIIARSDDGVM